MGTIDRTSATANNLPVGRVFYNSRGLVADKCKAGGININCHRMIKTTPIHHVRAVSIKNLYAIILPVGDQYPVVQCPGCMRCRKRPWSLAGAANTGN